MRPTTGYCEHFENGIKIVIQKEKICAICEICERKYYFCKNFEK